MPSGPRIRTDNVFGTLTDNPLTNVATTMNSAGLANLAAVSSAHAVIVLDPLRSAGAPEIVIVTAHTGSATSATITRGAYGTSARQHAQGTLWVHAPTVEDVIRIVTSSTRPSDPYEGQAAYETDTNRWIGYDGSAWQPSLHNPPTVRALRSSAQTISTATATSIALNAADTFDTDAMHDPASNNTRVTFNTAGVYVVTAGVGFDANATGVRVAWLRLNGSDSARIVQAGQTAVSASDVTDLALGVVYKFAATDYVELRVYQTSGGNLNTATLQQPFISAAWIGVG